MLMRLLYTNDKFEFISLSSCFIISEFSNENGLSTSIGLLFIFNDLLD